MAVATDGSLQKFITFVGTIYDLSTKYGAQAGGSAGGVAAANQRVMEWLRWEQYGGLDRLALIGPYDSSFIEYVQEHGIITPYDDFQDPFWPIHPRTAHLGATMNGVFLEGAQFGSPTTGEISHGDWIIFYGEWQRDYAYCQAKLAHPSTTFKMLDLLEGADGYNIAMQLRGSPDLAISDAVKQYCAEGTGGYSTRLNDFYNKRLSLPLTSAASWCLCLRRRCS